VAANKSTVANLPAEITHLYEEVQAKDNQIQELRAGIQQRDGSLQKFIKLNGSLVENPKEVAYSKAILANYEKAQLLQEEKIGLVEKAAALVCLLCRLYIACTNIDAAGPSREATGHEAARFAE